jgi:transcriptional accessory protein Tex/SPT6
VEGTENAEAPRRLADLKPAMKLEGRVTKIELFGAFIDVGVERDGLVHISRLKQGSVFRVDDVLEEGQEVEVWVHSVDSNAGRLELTMIRPVLLKWKDLKEGKRLKGRVMRLENFGAFVEIGAERPGLIHVSEMSNEYVSNPADIVRVGDEVEVVVVQVDRKKRQIRLSMKEAFIEFEAEEEEVDEETPTAMEFALRQALEGTEQEEIGPESSPVETSGSNQQELEDILERTLKHRVQSSSSNK